MTAYNLKGRQIKTVLMCGKCGSTAIVSHNDYNQAVAQRVPALTCLICGNRQEEGVPCRWPFFEEGTSRVAVQQEELGDEAVGERLKHEVGVFTAEELRKSKKQHKKTGPEIVEWELSA